MAFSEEKRKRKNIKLVKGSKESEANLEEDWALEPPDADEVDELLDDLEDVLRVTTGTSKEKRLDTQGFYSGCSPSVRVTEQDLKEALKAMSTPVGEAPRGLGGKTLTESRVESVEKTSVITPPEIRPNYRLALELSLVSGLLFLCLMLFSYFFFSNSLISIENGIKAKWSAYMVDQKKGEIRNLLFPLAKSMEISAAKGRKPEVNLTGKESDRLIDSLPASVKAEGLLVLWFREKPGKLKVRKAVGKKNIVYAGKQSIPLAEIATGKRNSLSRPLRDALAKVSSGEPGTYAEGVLKTESALPVVYGLKNIPKTRQVIGYLGVVDTSKADEILKGIGLKLKSFTLLIVGVEFAIFLCIVSYLVYYNRKRNKAIYHLGHHIDLMSLGDLEQKIRVNTGDDLDFLAKKLAAMQASFLGAISRLRRRRNI